MEKKCETNGYSGYTGYAREGFGSGSRPISGFLKNFTGQNDTRVLSGVNPFARALQPRQRFQSKRAVLRLFPTHVKTTKTLLNLHDVID